MTARWLLVGLALSVVTAAHADDEDPPLARPDPPDRRSGHPTLAAELAYGSLFGHAEQTLANSYGRGVVGVSQSRFAGYAWVPRLQLAYPFHRHVAVEARVGFASYGGTDFCRACSATSRTIGLGLVYHLVDGASVDPWFAFGGAHRSTHLRGPGFDVTYTGFDVARWTLGIDHYVVPQLGLGIVFEVALGTYTRRSPGALTERALGRDWTAFGVRATVAPFLTNVKPAAQASTRPR